MRYKVNQYLRKNKDLKGIVQKKSGKDFCTKCKLFFNCCLHERREFVFSSLLKFFNRFFYRNR
jgi:hypothetical protein